MASLPCTTFSLLQNFLQSEMPKAQRQEGLELLRVAVQGCKLQMKTGNMFIMEHLPGASSWTTDEMKSLTSMKGDVSGPGSVHARICERRPGRSGASQKDDKDCHKLVGSRTSVEYEMQPCN